MKRTYMTFGQVHAHSINGKTVDKDCVALFHNDEETARKYMRVHCGNKYFTTYDGETWDQIQHDHIDYYPRGIVDVGTVCV